MSSVTPATDLPASSISLTPTFVHVPILLNGESLIPGWVVDHESYRQWAKSDEFPERGRFSYLDGTIWADLTMEEFFSHNQLKGEFISVLTPLARSLDRGYYGTDGNLWTHVGARISTEPDGMFFTYDALQSGRVRLIQSKQKGYIEIEGSPNMTLEVVSNSSVKKDTVLLKEKCAQAGVDEYWLVDARGPELLFEIWHLHDGAYMPAPHQDGWLVSAVFTRSFKLQQGKDRLGHPSFQLLVRE